MGDATKWSNPFQLRFLLFRAKIGLIAQQSAEISLPEAEIFWLD